MKKQLTTIGGFVLLIIVLFGVDTQVAHADRTYDGTNGNDTIYFGYCSSCYSNGPGLRICRSTADESVEATFAKGSGTLLIDGKDGNDHIEAVHNEKRCKGDFCCQFDDFSLLDFSSIQIKGGNDGDCLFGTTGVQQIEGNGGNDFLAGASGVDVLRGGSGNDYLRGDQGDDELYGDGGDDILVGGTGHDLISGGLGDNTFRCRNVTSPTQWDGDEYTTDCDDMDRPRVDVQTQAIDPYKDWAYIPYCRNGVINEHVTTSNAHLLLLERAAGASILMQSGGDMPITGDFDNDGHHDDVALFRSATQEWFYDYNHNGIVDRGSATSDLIVRNWGLATDRPLAGDFDLDGRANDVAVFRAAERAWYFDYEHNGRREPDTPPSEGTATTDDVLDQPWASPGDIPIAGDFNRGGNLNDIGVFRPSSGMWYFDYNHDGTTDNEVGPWGLSGDIPLVGDFDRDGYADDIAVFRPSSGMWYFRTFSSTGDHESEMGPWGFSAGIPVAGDFDSDGYLDDIGLFRLSTQRWYYDYHHNGRREPDTPVADGNVTTDDISGSWGFPGEPRAVTHKQYEDTCGPASLNMVMEHLGLADRTRPAFGTQLLTGTGSATVDLGYHLSMEHIMYTGYRRYRELRKDGWIDDITGFISATGSLAVTAAKAGSDFDIRYNIGNVIYNPATGRTTGRVQSWMQHGPACGWEPGKTDAGLPWVANHLTVGGRTEAYPVSTTISDAATFHSLSHLKAVIKGYIDHDIPLVVAIESSNHFNTLIGYWERSDGFWIYTADPLDGWGRAFYNQPMRWRKLELDKDLLPGGSNMMTGMMLYGHRSSCLEHSWAFELDRTYGETLCVRRD